MKSQESSDKYNILYKERTLYSNLTKEEYFDVMQDLALEYYQTGGPNPIDLKTEIIGEN